MSGKLQEVVRYFLCRSQESGGKRPITNKKLQKLIYYAQAWNLVFNDEKLFEEDIEAWIHGPVIPVIYDKYKKYGRLPINEAVECNEKVFTVNELRVLKDVWIIYGKFDGDYLETLTHSEDPWIIARGNAEANESSNAIIDTNLMKSYYAEKNK